MTYMYECIELQYKNTNFLMLLKYFQGILYKIDLITTKLVGVLSLKIDGHLPNTFRLLYI